MSADPKYDELNRHLFEEGVKVRRAVLGDEYVDQALRNANEWTMPGQELITRFAWGDLWRRPGMDRRTRSLITMGFIIGQKAWLELALHTRGAINNGVTEVEIRELVLQATVYCGTPAGVEAMMVTQKTINDMIAKGEYRRPAPEASKAEAQELKVEEPQTDDGPSTSA